MKKQNLLLLILITLIATFPINAQKTNKCFILTGVPSADRIGAWYLNKLKDKNPEIICQAMGGQNLEQAGAQIYKNFNEFTIGVGGLGNFITKLPNIIRNFKLIKNYILDNNFDRVVLVDSPLINPLMARSLKKQKPELKITYVAPPEMWLWGKWGIDGLLKEYCNKIIVIHPNEVEWYKNQGIKAKWLEYPYYQELEQCFDLSENKTNKIAIFIGSRKVEIDTMVDIFAQVIKKLSDKHPELEFILPIPKYFQADTINQIKEALLQNNIDLEKISIAQDEKDKFKEFAQSCLAISKPGTNTLELALLKTPTIITYKVPFLTSLFIKLIYQESYVGLPNLLTDKDLCKELLQSECNTENIYNEAEKLYSAFINQDKFYTKQLNKLEELRNILKPQNPKEKI